MEDPRKRDLRKLLNLFISLNQSNKFHRQQIKYEDTRLFKSNLNGEVVHKKLEHLQNMWGFQSLQNETQRKLENLQATIQKFLDFNEDLKDAKEYKEATRLIEKRVNTNMEAECLKFT
ncbi:uncharacterized protein LOC26526269 [Drosophila erecta]|uniref:uncharacterized protein LOC26526269 n=1 Tax=Drosophila erecta TaxID=7220 RepID=UPI000732B903|nr:uncharacterized protein LOC26526269 [Drosophila erecta]KQS38552.1 uncharacterized protein Dere_GG26445 [Drosophila erecta]